MSQGAETTSPQPARKRLPIVRIVLGVLVTVAIVAAGLALTARHAIARDSALSQGELAPDFTLPDQNGTPVTLSKVLEAHRGAIVAFYPKDFTPG